MQYQVPQLMGQRETLTIPRPISGNHNDKLIDDAGLHTVEFDALLY